MVGLEETQFLENIRQGMPLLEEVLVSSAKSEGVIAGAVVFELYDTYGFPPELVDEIGRREYGLAVDMDGFNSRDGG